MLFFRAIRKIWCLGYLSPDNQRGWYSFFLYYTIHSKIANFVYHILRLEIILQESSTIHLESINLLAWILTIFTFGLTVWLLSTVTVRWGLLLSINVGCVRAYQCSFPFTFFGWIDAFRLFFSSHLVSILEATKSSDRWCKNEKQQY